MNFSDSQNKNSLKLTLLVHYQYLHFRITPHFQHFYTITSDDSYQNKQIRTFPASLSAGKRISKKKIRFTILCRYLYKLLLSCQCISILSSKLNKTKFRYLVFLFFTPSQCTFFQSSVKGASFISRSFSFLSFYYNLVQLRQQFLQM